VAKKQKKGIPERAPTKRQLSKWQRQMRIRRITLIAAAVFLAGILSWVGYELYHDRAGRDEPWRQTVLHINGVNFTMEYYVDMFNALTKDIEPDVIASMSNYVADMVADRIIEFELLRQGAKDLGVEVTSQEIDARLLEYELPPNNRVYRDIVSATLSQEKLEDHFGRQLPTTMEQAHVQAMFVESEEVASEVLTAIHTSGNFTALAEQFSCNSSVEGDLGWLPKKLMPNTLVGNAAFNLTRGEVGQPICDDTATKEIGYWLIEVTGKEGQAVEARAILLGSKENAEMVKSELVGGNFSSLAEQYSQHESKNEGGNLGRLEPGDMDSEAFDEVAFNISVNEVSEPVKDQSVQTTGGCWLVKVLDTGDHPLDQGVKTQLINERFDEWFEQWKANSTIENLLDAQMKAWAVEQVLQRR
jgi:parvulin-like peptidyl-prolyl isomerase